MSLFHRKTGVSEYIYKIISEVSDAMELRFISAVERGVMPESHQIVLNYVTQGAKGAARLFIVEDEAPYRTIQQSDLAEKNSPVASYIVLLRIFFYLLARAMKQDKVLAQKIGVSINKLIAEFAESTEFPAKTFGIADYAKLEKNESLAAAISMCLLDFRLTLCNKNEIPKEWKPPHVLNGMPKLSIEMYFVQEFSDFAGYWLKTLRNAVYEL